MSLSKLGSTSRGSSVSQIAFDGQNLFSGKQHPLFQPTILDNIFSYLTFPELKSNRHVCKAWSEVGVPLIARRKLKLVKFSDIKNEDFLALKHELVKSPNKVKLFQGFQLQWDEMTVWIWNNSLESFKPSQIVISGRNVCDPGTKLRNLLQPVLTTLTDLSLEIHKDSTSVSALVNILAQIGSMTLKRLCLNVKPRKHRIIMDITYQEVHNFLRAYEGVFQSQSQSLEEFQLSFNCEVSNYETLLEPKIDEFEVMQLPVFPRLHHLNLAVEITESEDAEIYFCIFTPFDFCVKFPQLVKLDILDSTLNTMKDDTIILTIGHPLKKLNILDGHFLSDEDEDNSFDIFQKFYSSFPYLEELAFGSTPFLRLNHGGIEIPWVDTLRTLEAEGSLQLNLGHLKKLEDLHYIINQDIDDFEDPWIPTLIETLLEHHRQLPHLKRLRLTFPDTVISITPESLDEIQEGLPANLRAILTIDDS